MDDEIGARVAFSSDHGTVPSRSTVFSKQPRLYLAHLAPRDGRPKIQLRFVVTRNGGIGSGTADVDPGAFEFWVEIEPGDVVLENRGARDPELGVKGGEQKTAVTIGARGIERSFPAAS